MSSRLKALWHMLGGECFYCGRPTWVVGGGESKADVKKRLGITTTRERRLRMATLEHLHRRSDGGLNEMINLTMACVECNSGRHERPALIFLSEMRERYAGADA